MKAGIKLLLPGGTGTRRWPPANSIVRLEMILYLGSVASVDLNEKEDGREY